MPFHEIVRVELFPLVGHNPWHLEQESRFLRLLLLLLLLVVVVAPHRRVVGKHVRGVVGVVWCAAWAVVGGVAVAERKHVRKRGGDDAVKHP